MIASRETLGRTIRFLTLSKSSCLTMSQPSTTPESVHDIYIFKRVYERLQFLPEEAEGYTESFDFNEFSSSC
jgi:hypothetical protein